MRNAGSSKLGYYPLPVEEARNIRRLAGVLRALLGD